MSNLVTKSAAEKVETPAVVEPPETPIEHVRTEELEVRNKIGAGRNLHHRLCSHFMVSIF